MADEPLFMAIPKDDPEYQRTVRDAQATLPEFRARIRTSRRTGAIPCVKTLIRDGEEEGFIWLNNAREQGEEFVAEVFEIPPEFVSLRVGDQLLVKACDVRDWMVNEDGVLHGGFSLRYARSKLPREKRTWYDDYVGVKRYA